MARVPVQISVADPATGAALNGVSATVKHRITAANLTLYAAETGGSTLSNPLTTDANGRATAWVDRAPLRIDYAGTGLTSWTEYRDVGPSSDRGIDALLLPAGASPALVAALPGSPADGDEVYYQSAAMAALGQVWRLRYRAAAAGSYKWEYLGGSPLFAEVATYQAPGSITTYLNLATDGPAITVPLAGAYLAEYSVAVTNTDASAHTMIAGVALGDTNPFHNVGNVLNLINANNGIASLGGITAQITAAAAGAVYKLRYYVSGTVTGKTFGQRTLKLTPIRVG